MGVANNHTVAQETVQVEKTRQPAELMKPPSLLALTLAATMLVNVRAFTPHMFETKQLSRIAEWKLSADTADPDAGEEDEDQPIMESKVTFDDGGSDLTDRFKYKVQALMGSYDPAAGEDDERQDGNILNAMLTFPARYTFNIVGRVDGDSAIQEEYISQVKEVVLATSGDTDDLVCMVTPRGKNFVKLQCEVTVESALMINGIYDDLDKLERTKMRF